MNLDVERGVNNVKKKEPSFRQETAISVPHSHQYSLTQILLLQ